LRASWLKRIKELDVDMLVFLDETHAYLNMSRGYGRAPTSERLTDHEPKGEKISSSLIAAVTNQGLNHSLIDPESMTKATFLTFLDKVLLPNIDEGSILIMDNWRGHHGPDVRDLIASYNCEVIYLPAYSPDFNPIEYLFSKIKAFIRGLRPMTRDDLKQAFVDAVLSISLTDAINTFRHCKYY